MRSLVGNKFGYNVIATCVTTPTLHCSARRKQTTWTQKAPMHRRTVKLSLFSIQVEPAPHLLSQTIRIFLITNHQPLIQICITVTLPVESAPFFIPSTSFCSLSSWSTYPAHITSSQSPPSLSPDYKFRPKECNYKENMMDKHIEFKTCTRSITPIGRISQQI